MECGNWTGDFTGRYGIIISDQPTGIDDAANIAGYGGHLVCETACPKFRHLLLKAPQLLETLTHALNALELYMGPSKAIDRLIASGRELIRQIESKQ